MPDDKKCIKALFNYISSIQLVTDSRLELHLTEDTADYLSKVIDVRSGIRLIDYWEKEIEKECGVELDSKLAEEINTDEQNTLREPIIDEVSYILGTTPEELKKIQEEAIRKEKEVEGVLFV